MNINNNAYHVDENSFMDEINHKYAILYRWMKCECTNHISFDKILDIQINCTLHE